jgi:hypothetical protein
MLERGVQSSSMQCKVYIPYTAMVVYLSYTILFNDLELNHPF